MRRAPRWLLSLYMFVTIASICLVASPALAGGSVWHFDQPSYEPGDVVRASAVVSWEHNPSLGTPDDGPYGMWIRIVDSSRPVHSPDPAYESVYVGDVRIDVGFPSVGRAEFVLPNLAPGLYELLHCNWPCTTTLGDITWGRFWVGPPDPSREPTSGYPFSEQFNASLTTTTTSPATTTTSPATTTTAPATTTTEAETDAGESRESGSSGTPVVPIALGGAAVLAGSSVAVARSRRR